MDHSGTDHPASRFDEPDAHVVGTERHAPNAGAVGETVKLGQHVR